MSGAGKKKQIVIIHARTIEYFDRRHKGCPNKITYLSYSVWLFLKRTFMHSAGWVFFERWDSLPSEPVLPIYGWAIVEFKTPIGGELQKRQKGLPALSKEAPLNLTWKAAASKVIEGIISTLPKRSDKPQAVRLETIVNQSGMPEIAKIELSLAENLSMLRTMKARKRKAV